MILLVSFWLSLDGRCAGGCGHGVSAYGARDPFGDRGVDPKLEQAATTLGAGPIRVFLTITVPMMAPGLVAGVVLAFAKAMGEFGATITFVANIPGQTQTLPSAIYAFLQVPGGDASAVRLLVLSVFISVLALALSEWMARRVVHGTGQ